MTSRHNSEESADYHGSCPFVKIKFKDIQGPYEGYVRRTKLTQTSIFISIYKQVQFTLDNLTSPSINQKLELSEKFTKCINIRLRGLGERREPPSRVAFSACFRPQNASGRKKNMILLPLVRVLENRIQALSRTFRHRFKDFQDLENLEKLFQDFQGPTRALHKTENNSHAHSHTH